MTDTQDGSIDWNATSISKTGYCVFIECESGAMAEDVFELICSLAEMGVQMTSLRGPKESA